MLLKCVCGCVKNKFDSWESETPGGPTADLNPPSPHPLFYSTFTLSQISPGLIQHRKFMTHFITCYKLITTFQQDWGSNKRAPQGTSGYLRQWSVSVIWKQIPLIFMRVLSKYLHIWANKTKMKERERPGSHDILSQTMSYWKQVDSVSNHCCCFPSPCWAKPSFGLVWHLDLGLWLSSLHHFRNSVQFSWSESARLSSGRFRGESVVSLLQAPTLSLVDPPACQGKLISKSGCFQMAASIVAMLPKQESKGGKVKINLMGVALFWLTVYHSCCVSHAYLFGLTVISSQNLDALANPSIWKSI